MAVHLPYLGEQAVEGNPRVDVNDGPEEDRDELIVVGDVYEVLVRQGDARGQIHEKEHPATARRMTEHGEGANKNAVEKEEELERGFKAAQAILLHRLGLVVEEGNDCVERKLEEEAETC